MLAVLGGRADVERDLVRTRTAEGRSRSQKRGQQMGRPSKHQRRTQGGSTAATRGRCHPLPISPAATTLVKARFRGLHGDSERS
jgi:hypothetical protein